MAFQRYFSQEWKTIRSSVVESESSKGCFDCNICLDFAHEPVVTLCGHLYCWPCIYKWLHVQSDSLASHEHPQCPVCKADISHTTMIPLYGRGQSTSDSEGKTPSRGMIIPPRPPACGVHIALPNAIQSSQQQLPYRNPSQSQHYQTHPEDTSSPLMHFGGSMTPGMHNPVVGMVYARVFGNSESIYTYPNSYQLMGSNSPRLRRQEMQADKSLNRISIFLFCCFLLCLTVF